jgi:N-glycosylase/DNA lyase
MNQNVKKLKIKINAIKKDLKTKKTIDKTLESFKSYKKATNEMIFSELCYCILTANCQAKTCILIQKTFPHKFSNASKKQIKQHLQTHNYRFPNIRSTYIFEAQTYKNKLKNILHTYKGPEKRDWFIHNIKGLGMKEASHFLRNIGYQNYAIIDTHILSLLQNYEIFQKPKTITKNRYIKIEKELKHLANLTDLTPAALDLYLWYMQTGSVLK